MKTPRKPKYKLKFFIADEVILSSFRDEIASMEHPFFSMKGGNTKIREYQYGNINLIVRPPSVIGLATVFDKDIWIYSVSKLQEAINNHQEINRTIYFTPYDFFVATNRDKSGRAYEDLKKALTRLSGTRIETNIIYSNDSRKTENFGLIDKWVFLEKKKGNLDIGMIKVTLPDWLYNALKKKKVLQISPDYFHIRKAINRRLYEIARKYCGNQWIFSITLEKLHVKTGSTALLKMFRHNIKKLSKKNDLPDYNINYDITSDKVIFSNRNFRINRLKYNKKSK